MGGTWTAAGGAATGVALALLVSVLPVGSAAFAAAQEFPESWTRPADAVRIADNLFYVGSQGLGAFLLTSSEGHILVDAPFEENVPGILDNIRSLGFDPGDVRILLHSHAHMDHVGGLAAMQEATGAELLINQADAVFVEAGQNFGLPDDVPGYRPARVARSVEHREVVRLGEISLTAHLTPGHTPGCTTWTGTASIEGDPFDFAILCSLTVLEDYRIVGPDATYPGQGEDFCRSLSHLRTLDTDLFLAPHAAWFGLWEKHAAREEGNALAFVDPERYRTYLDVAEVRLERALADQGHEGGCDALLRSGHTKLPTSRLHA